MPLPNSEPRTRREGTAFAAIFGVCVLFYAGLAAYFQRVPFAHDELWGVPHANYTFLESLIFTLRYDLHPPLYYLQLVLWGSVDNSDFWLRLNSVFWVSVAAFCCYRYVRDRVSWVVAVLVALSLFFSFSLNYYAMQLRMYTMLAALAVLGFVIVDELAEQPLRRWWDLRWVAVVSLAEAYSHGAGFLLVMSQFVYAACFQLTRRDFGSLVRWSVFHAVLAVASAPVVVLMAAKSVSHTVAPTLQDVWLALAFLFAGPGQALPVTGWLVVVLFLGLVAATVARGPAQSRFALLAYLLFPMAFAMAVSHTVKPFWLARVFVYAIGPVTIAFALMARKGAPGRTAWRGALAALAGLCVLNANLSLVPETGIDYRAVSSALEEAIEPGDCVYVQDGFSTYWGIARYLAGAKWGDPLTVQAASSQRWEDMINRVPSPWRERLWLVPDRDYFVAKGVRFFAGTQAMPAANCQATFFVASEDVPEDQKPGVIPEGQVISRNNGVDLIRVTSIP